MKLRHLLCLLPLGLSSAAIAAGTPFNASLAMGNAGEPRDFTLNRSPAVSSFSLTSSHRTYGLVHLTGFQFEEVVQVPASANAGREGSLKQRMWEVQRAQRSDINFAAMAPFVEPPPRGFFPPIHLELSGGADAIDFGDSEGYRIYTGMRLGLPGTDFGLYGDYAFHSMDRRPLGTIGEFENDDEISRYDAQGTWFLQIGLGQSF